MASLNKVFLAGNLTKDPEVRYTSNGQAVAGLDLAINHSFVSKAGEKKDEVVYVHVVVWGKQAQSSGQYLKKGSPVLIEGRLQLDTWETPQGEKRSRLKVQANRVQFLGSSSRNREEGAGYSEASSRGPADSNPSGSSSAPVEGFSDLPTHSNEIEDDDIPF